MCGQQGDTVMNTIELIQAGNYKAADRRFGAYDLAKANRRKRINQWALDVAAMAIDQQHDKEHADDLPNYRCSLEQDLCDALRQQVPNVTDAELDRAVMSFRAALPPQFND